jgi:ribosomal protein S21
VKDLALVTLGPELSLDRALKELRRRFDRAGVPAELRRREAAASPGEKRRAKSARARIRARKLGRRLAADG